MAILLTLKESDALKTTTFQVFERDSSGNEILISLVGGSAILRYRLNTRLQSPPTITRSLTIPPGTAAEGICQYTWQAADTASPGIYNAEIVATLANGRQQTFPESGFFQFEIEQNL